MSLDQLPSRIASTPIGPVWQPMRAQDAEQVPSSRLFTVLARRKWLLVVVTLAVAMPAAWFIYGLPKYYDAQAALMINTRKAAFRDLQATVETTDADAIAVGTQVGIIRSLAMALGVVDRLNLSQAPEFARVLDRPPSALAVAVDRLSAMAGHPPAPKRRLTREDRRQITAQMLSGKTTVVNDGHSYIITISARTGDAALSAAIANAYSDLYLDFNRSLKIAAIRRANSLLDDEMAPMRDRLRAADEAVETYRQRNGLITGRSGAPGTPLGGGTVSEEQLAQINTQLIAATGELTERRASLRQIRAAQRSGQLDSIPEVVASPLINTLRAQQAELGSRVASLSQTALSQNPLMQSATASSTDVERRINAEVGKIAAAVASEAAAADARVASLTAALNQLQGTVAVESRANVSLRQLESEAAAARGVYQDFLGRFEHTSSESALQEPEADLVSAAPVPFSPSGPPRLQLLALVTAAALGIGAALALLLDRMRQGLRNTEQLEAATGMFGLGLVPILKGGVRRQFEGTALTPYTGALGQIASMLRFGNAEFRARVVLVTSAAPGEGKTVFAISLAATVGREGGRALLVDCDLHRPAVAAALNLSPGTLPDSAGKGGRPAVLHQSALPGLDILTLQAAGGQLSGATTEALRRLIEDARARYDLIVLDTPPVLAFADAPILSLQTDGAIMVVRWRRTPVAAVTSALRMLRAYNVRLLGGVVTQVNTAQLDEAEGGHAYLYRTHAAYFR